VPEIERPRGDHYLVTDAERAKFERDGWVRLPSVLTPAELAELEPTYMAFLRREIPVPGRDFCDMAGEYAKSVEEYSIVNVMLPRRYHPALRGNVYERRAAGIARQLCGDGLVLDYDQFVAKPPHKHDAVFHWHQDLGYWPQTEDTRTASFWLAFDETRADNGCLRFVNGSHRETQLRGHAPVFDDRERSHTCRRWSTSSASRLSSRSSARATSPCTTSARSTAQPATPAPAGVVATSWRSAAKQRSRPNVRSASRIPTTTIPNCCDGSDSRPARERSSAPAAKGRGLAGGSASRCVPNREASGNHRVKGPNSLLVLNNRNSFARFP
jgi:hypothetical protein